MMMMMMIMTTMMMMLMMKVMMMMMIYEKLGSSGICYKKKYGIIMESHRACPCVVHFI